MKHALWVVMVVTLVVPVAAIGFGARPVFGCEVRKDINPASDSDSVVLARIDRVARDWHYPQSDTSFLLTLHVERTLQGETQRSDIEVATPINPPTQNGCAEFDPAALTGHTAVVALEHNSDGSLSTSRAGTWVVGTPYVEFWDDDLAALLQPAAGGSATPLAPAAGSGSSNSGSGEARLAVLALGAVLIAASAGLFAVRRR